MTFRPAAPAGGASSVGGWDRRPISTKISMLAGRQSGYVTRAQLLEAGLSVSATDRRVKSGRLIVEHAGVYALEYRRREPIAKAAAAVLACGPGAVLSHESAAVLWGMRKRWPEPGTNGARHRSTPRSETAGSGDRARPAGAVLETRGAAGDRRAAPAPPRRDQAQGGPRELAETPTRSEFEREFLRFVKRYGLPIPRVNHRIAGHEADIVFERERVIVELDGYDTHGTRRSFESDRERDAATLAAGYVTIRITWERLKFTPQREAERLHRILENRRRHAA